MCLFLCIPLIYGFLNLLAISFLPCIFLYIPKALVLGHVYCIISSSLPDSFEFCLFRHFFYLCSQSFLYIMNILFYNPGFYICCFYKPFQLQGIQICIFILFQSFYNDFFIFKSFIHLVLFDFRRKTGKMTLLFL